MRLLLDSHVLLWWLDDPQGLIARPLREAIQDPLNDVFFSAASIWEIGLKAAKGRLRVPSTIVTLLHADGFEELFVTSRHATLALTLPPLHGDPFDRMLIAQTLSEGFILGTRDTTIARYDVPVMEA